MTPSVESSQDRFLAIENETATLTCTATGVPAPTIGFMINGIVLDRMGSASPGADLRDRVNLQEQSESTLSDDRLYMVTRTLEIFNPVGRDTGNYTCTANVTIEELLNITFSDQYTFELIVQSELGLIFFKS